WYGYDPFDILESKFHSLVRKHEFSRKFFEKGVYELFPRTSRFILGINKNINAKAMALLAQSFLFLYKLYNDNQYLEKSKECLNWLLENISPNYQGACWGYPFNWQSRIFIPKSTPSSVVTSIAMDALLTAYDICDENKYLETAQSCIIFFLNDLNIDKQDERHFCFSYTPLDNFHVHNANLFVAKQLIRIGHLTKNEEYNRIGEKSLQYTLSHQNGDGSWYYWGPPDKLLYNIDNFHTGYVLRAIYSIYLTTKEERLLHFIKKGLNYYLKNLFQQDVIPKLWYDGDYPIDIHCCAESILCLTLLSDHFPDCLGKAISVAKWTIKNMQHKRGFFYYRIYCYFTNKLPFIRWGQAWMLLALSNLRLKLKEIESY
ncbi:MAG: hypothetical protein ACFFDN_45065, partial [Candidatus Hodarchaeota archaeon]